MNYNQIFTNNRTTGAFFINNFSENFQKDPGKIYATDWTFRIVTGCKKLEIKTFQNIFTVKHEWALYYSVRIKF